MKPFITILVSGCLCMYTATAQESDRDLRRQRRAMPATQLIISASPVHVTEENIGIGISVELFTDTKGLFSVVLPISYSFAPSYNNYYGYPYTYSSPYPPYLPPAQQTYYNTRDMFYFYPGFKIYPTGANKKVSYAVGANLVIGIGGADKVNATYTIDSTVNNGTVYYFTSSSSAIIEGKTRFKTGILVSNSLNLRPTKHLYLGVDLGLGYSYVDNVDGMNYGRGAMVQLGMKFGYAK